MAFEHEGGFATRQIHAARPEMPGINPLSTPIFQSSTFIFDNAEQGARRFTGEEQGYIYTRLGNPNSDEVAKKIASLEGGEAGLMMSSGMGAITAVIWTLLSAGDHLLADISLYGCTYKYFTRGLARYGVEITQVDFADFKAVEKAVKPNTRVLYCESASNPDLKLNDIGAISRIAHAHGAKLVVDNTFMSPYLFRPIEHGADVSVHSATKYLNGHGDVIAGAAVGTAEFMAEVAVFGLKDMTGAVIGPFDAFLINRGLKTLDIRMEKHSQNAMKVARALEAHPAVKRCLYPGLESHPQHELAKRTFTNGYGGMICLELNCDRARASQFINSLKLCTLAVSLGDATTLIEHPASMTHSTYEPEELIAAGMSESMIRLSVGLEDANDIIDDLVTELDKIEL